MPELEAQEKGPVVTVIMPVYNAVKYLEAAVNSVLAQTFKEFELILVDDGATDGSGELCDAFAERDSRIRVFHKENGGVSSARNWGMRCARGEYIAFIDHDDCYLPDFLQQMLTFIRQSGAHMVKCGRLNIRVDKDGHLVKYAGYSSRQQEYMSNSEFAKRYLDFREKTPLLTAVWNGLYQKDFVQQHQIEFPEDLHYGSEDVTFNYKMFVAGTDIAFFSGILYIHYIREQQSTSAVFHPELIPTKLDLTALEREFICREAEEDLGVLRYMQFNEVMLLLCRVKDMDYQKKYVREIAAQIPLKGCPLKYLSRHVGSIKMICWLLLWLRCYQIYFWSFRLAYMKRHLFESR